MIKCLIKSFFCKRTQRGFLLIELCIVLSVLGVLIGVGGALLRGYFKKQQNTCTRAHQKQILDAIGWFVLREKRLPCPASYETQGVELLHCGHCWKGLVPFRTLGLSEQVAKDGFGNWISFVVEPSLTEYQVKNTSALELCKFVLETKSTLTLIEKEVSITEYCKEDGIILILISHGPSEYSFKKHFKELSQCKHMNTQEGKRYCYAPSPQDNGLWNDQLVFFTKSQLLKKIGLKCKDYFVSLDYLDSAFPPP
ncbi:type II secretion system protein [Holospora undulata]|uniref:Uncharacterized protein n=1 Tax=Holospora undulata HU1 TaxID=1321371 RepID=A0A061JGH0_9PROT|nr:type II secretion system GspH family protein [Holospora undulata]ETZ05161.1 hypothetical protein K737_300415 [Holospora undulata HU1]